MNSQHHIRTKAIILKKYPQGENDWNILFYSPELGKVRAIAKGARKINSTKAGHLEPLNLCHFQLYQSRYRLTIQECKVQKSFKTIREHFDGVVTATMILEIFQKSTYATEHSEELFDLLEATLQSLEKSTQPMLVVEGFKLKLMEEIGVLPDLKICFSCHNHWQQNQNIWLNEEGHLCCENCIRSLPKITSTDEIVDTQLARHDEREYRGYVSEEERCQPGWRRSSDGEVIFGRLLNSSPHFFSKIGFEVLKLTQYLSRKNIPTSGNQKITMNQEQKNQLSLITRLFLNHYIGQEILSEKWQL